MHVSLYMSFDASCVLIFICMCPYLNTYVSSSLVHTCMCPYLNATESVDSAFAVMPVEDLPFHGDVDDTVYAFLPLIETLYDMPALKPEEGTSKWIKFMKNNIEKGTCPHLYIHVSSLTYTRPYLYSYMYIYILITLLHHNHPLLSPATFSPITTFTTWITRVSSSSM